MAVPPTLMLNRSISMNTYESFVYEWTNTDNDMKYIGSHKGTVDDGYISSSKYFLKDYRSNPSKFIRNIISFGNVEDMRELESRLLQEVNAASNPQYYNKHNQNGKFVCQGHTEETKSKMKKRVPWNKGKKNIYNEETLIKMRKAKENFVPWNTGMSPSEDTRKKLSEYKGENHHFYGKKRPEHSEKMKLAWERRRNAQI